MPRGKAYAENSGFSRNSSALARTMAFVASNIPEPDSQRISPAEEELIRAWMARGWLSPPPTHIWQGLIAEIDYLRKRLDMREMVGRSWPAAVTGIMRKQESVDISLIYDVGHDATEGLHWHIWTPDGELIHHHGPYLSEAEAWDAAEMFVHACKRKLTTCRLYPRDGVTTAHGYLNVRERQWRAATQVITMLRQACSDLDDEGYRLLLQLTLQDYDEAAAEPEVQP